jgi:uncharacterized membrane protein
MGSIITIQRFVISMNNFLISRLACDNEPRKKNVGLKLFLTVCNILVTVVSFLISGRHTGFKYKLF